MQTAVVSKRGTLSKGVVNVGSMSRDMLIGDLGWAGLDQDLLICTAIDVSRLSRDSLHSIQTKFVGLAQRRFYTRTRLQWRQSPTPPSPTGIGSCAARVPGTQTRSLYHTTLANASLVRLNVQERRRQNRFRFYSGCGICIRFKTSIQARCRQSPTRVR